MKTISYRPESLEEALQVMQRETLKPIAGGTDVMIRARNWQGASRNFKQDVIFINHLKELKHIEVHPSGYSIGACVTQSEMINDSRLPEYVRHVTAEMATPAIRNAATIGGNIVNAASVADLLPVLYAADAQLKLKSVDSERIVDVRDFIVDKYKTLRQPNELLVEILLPKLEIQSFTYRKMGQRKASILSKVSFLALCTPMDVRLTLGALNDTVIRAKEAEALIISRAPKGEIIKAFESHYKSHDDKRSTKAYKEQVADNLILDWLEDYMKR